ncbi:MAG: biopolymer transporter ExbD [Planctomycetota bacterium]
MRHRSSIPEPRIELMPLIDVVFLLLTFFIFALVLSARLEVTDIQLPSTSAGEAPQGGEYMVLELRPGGDLMLSRKAVEWDSLVASIEAERVSRPDAVLLIAPDIGSSSGDLFKLVDTLSQGGIRDLRFLRAPAPATATPAGAPPS